MDDARGVELAYVLHKRPEHGEQPLGGEAALGLHLVAEGHAVEVLHDEIGRAVGGEEVLHLHHGLELRLLGEQPRLVEKAVERALELGGHAGLGLDALAVRRAHGALDGEALLDRDALAAVGLHGDVGYAEAALADGRAGEVAVQAAAVEHRSGRELLLAGRPARGLAAALADGAGGGVHAVRAEIHHTTPPFRVTMKLSRSEPSEKRSPTLSGMA